MKKTKNSSMNYAALYLASLLCLALALSSCAHRKMREPMNLKIAVLDMGIPEIFTEGKDLKGWWFSSRDVYYNPNAGDLFSDLLAKRLSQLSYIDVYSRIDYEYYVARKLERLKESFPNLQDKEIRELYEESSPIDIGKDLSRYWGVDKVIYGRITSGGMIHNRTIHWWRSGIAAEIRLADVDSGEVEWSTTISKSKNLRSEYRVMELAVEDLVKRMVKEYFLKPD